MARRHLSELGIGWRVTLTVAGIVLLIVGFAGLALPGIQGVVTLVFALVLLSIASETTHRLVRRGFRRWPQGWRRFLRGRRWVERHLRPKHKVEVDHEAGEKRDDQEAPPPGSPQP
ncbi:MAG: hypothetical protein K8J08_08375 [Thermoanaerobaculia bacterium]|nr:hypothetical protein [Thermoanaerobaculia bacterium]